MCPYYDAETGFCRLTDVNHYNDGNCKDPDYWGKCPNIK